MRRWILIGILLLVGCDDKSTANTDKASAGRLSMPALPIVQQSIMTLSPLFEGDRHDGHINELCAWVRGEKSEQEIAEYLKSQQITATSDNDYALFLPPKRPEQATACAAYIATTVLIAPNPAEFLEAKTPSSAQKKAAEQNKQDEVNEETLQINQEKLTESLARKLAITQANSDIFALIIQQLPPGLTLDAYHKEVQRLFGLLSSHYLDRVQMYYMPDVLFQPLQLQENHFAFTSSTGFLFEFGIQGLHLQLDGITWYGQGQLMGKTYYLPVSYYPEEVTRIFSKP